MLDAESGIEMEAAQLLYGWALNAAKKTITTATTQQSTLSPTMQTRLRRPYRFLLLHPLRRRTPTVTLPRSPPAQPAQPILRTLALTPQSPPAQTPPLPVVLRLLDPMAPPLAHGRPRPVQPYQRPYLLDFAVAPRRAHAMHPRALAALEEELAADLLEIAALEGFAARGQPLEDGLHAVDQQVRLHVCGFGAEVECACHAEVVVDFACRLGVDGEGARGCCGVHGDELRAAAADDGDGGWGREGEESFGGNGGGEGAEVFLAVLGGNVSGCVVAEGGGMCLRRRRSAG